MLSPIKNTAKKPQFSLMAALLLSCTLTGCEVLLIGGGAVGGYMLGKDERSAGTIASDALLTSSIKAALFSDKEIKALDINVDTYNGDVTLVGHVSRAELIDRVVGIAKETKGVKSVKSHLIVIKPHST